MSKRYETLEMKFCLKMCESVMKVAEDIATEALHSDKADLDKVYDIAVIIHRGEKTSRQYFNRYHLLDKQINGPE
jgi:hypothetical protein